MTLYGEERPPPADDRPTVQVKAVSWPVEEPVRPAPPDGTPARSPRFRLLLASGVATAVLGSVGAVAIWAYAGDVPRGTSVLGTELGGRSRSDAARELRAQLDRRAAELAAPLQVRVGEKTAEIDPAEVGLTVDVDATVATAAATSAHAVDRLVGSREIEPVVSVDVPKLEAALEKLVGNQGRKMTMPAITFSGTKPKVRYPKPSLAIDPEHSAQVVKEGWLSGQPVTVPLVENHPTTTSDEVDRLVAELAEPAVAAPVKLTTDRGSVTISPEAIAKGLRFKADKTGKLTPSVDVKQLRSALGNKLGSVEVAPKNATMTISGGKPKISDGRAGQQVDTSKLGDDLLAVLPRADERTVSADLKPVQPKLTAEKLGELGIKEKVASFTTNFTGGLSSPRSQNIVTIANDVKGTVVLPGDTFSLNGHTGERGYAQGYRDAPVILDGKLVPGVGGGTSQFTTTLFNATYYAGLEDVEHKPHSYYFSRYPAVIESTIFWPNLDFKFRNNTDYGVLIDTSYTGSSVTVSIWSTKIWDSVKTEYGPRRNITSPKTVYLDPGPTCIPANGSQGFTQDAFRVIKKDGKTVKREKFSWTYSAEPRFICAKAPS
ncbi:Vancomycin resistance protein YoaR, contains peptidoglycan-binding and VanW domains [Micromonospora phaseoli]|uniref:Vancomycin resistance protein YoaR, contains peptidoglycan-binding and VanW domains n=1 Tax=Micromonospora phaseoli TaxID=1144548 RepID=A0A1H7DEV6_9ACTN|nr:VanW family protein [Micromonospora phaseoli]PZV90466.1 vancomycin resistance protein YoaR [Micromonospora phaseoli]GIJ78142.1 vanomycin resistance protein VanB [Micromonospora phaseoli]SEK00343.1 Vancomycin resistance protein YoaR, contains peptidoglycan-binding and VanW domains [Micromonospora phaseoli]